MTMGCEWLLGKEGVVPRRVRQVIHHVFRCAGGKTSADDTVVKIPYILQEVLQSCPKGVQVEGRGADNVILRIFRYPAIRRANLSIYTAADKSLSV